MDRRDCHTRDVRILPAHSTLIVPRSVMDVMWAVREGAQQETPRIEA
jgi:hypothetical protein